MRNLKNNDFRTNKSKSMTEEMDTYENKTSRENFHLILNNNQEIILSQADFHFIYPFIKKDLPRIETKVIINF